MRLALSILIACSVSVSVSVEAFAAGLDSTTVKQLAQLEQKYFGQTYTTESPDTRTDRLEKLIFGGSNTGDPTQRIKNIFSAVDEPVVAGDTGASSDSASSSVSPAQKPAGASTKPSGRVSKSSKHEQTASTPAPTTPAETADKIEGEDPYPRISALETEILKKSYPSDSLGARLARMEEKAFNKASTSNDYSQRSDDLEAYAEKTLHKKPFNHDPYAGDDTDVAQQPKARGGSSGQQVAQNQFEQSSDYGSGTVYDTSQSAYPHITNLETAILGETYTKEQPNARLARMETKAFGKASTSDDLSSRTDALEAYAEKKLHKKPMDPPEGYETADGNAQQQQSQKSNKLLSMAGSALLGLAGVNTMPIGGSNLPMGFGMGGIGPNAMGFGGVRARPRSSVQQAPETPAAPAVKPDDPAVNAPDPPPDSAKMLTKVGWCEVQVFGHTNPTEHLEERLAHLNDELNFAPGQRGFELMDDVPAMIKSVQGKGGKSTTRTIGTKPTAATH